MRRENAPVDALVPYPGTLGVIHARGGSKRIPMKNIALVDGKPLITYMIDAARGSQLLDRLLVSTDHPEIARIAREAGAEVPFLRPADLAEDVPSERVTQHAVRFVEAEGYPVTIALTLQPTTPFVHSDDLDACILQMIEHPDLDTVLTVTPVHERPEWMYRPHGKGGQRVVPYTGRLVQGEEGVSQSLPPLYIPSGACWATRRRVLFRQGLITGPRAGVVVMPRERSVDIDDPIDLVVADAIARQRRVDRGAAFAQMEHAGLTLVDLQA